jgi:hypothetical protein
MPADLPSFTALPEAVNRGRNLGEIQGHTGDSVFACSNLSPLASSLFSPVTVDSTHFRPRVRRLSRAACRSRATDNR